MITLFKYSSEGIMKAVKRESSYIGVRRFSEDGVVLLDDIVYDEAYEIQFRDHFLAARGNVVEATLAYGKSIDEGHDFFEIDDMYDKNDFNLFLDLPANFAYGMAGPLTSRIKDYLVAYILYRWLETKLPQEAQVHLERSIAYLQDVKRYCEMRTERKRRVGRYY